jgi:hypothetical protein
MRKRIVFIVLLYANTAIAQYFPPNASALTDELQKLSTQRQKMQLVWWLPFQYWLTVMPPEQRDTVAITLAPLQKYTLIGVADGEIGDFGVMRYRTRSEILKNIKIQTATDSYSPLPEDFVDAETKSILTNIKPILTNILGELGTNFHFILFQGKDAAEVPLVIPTEKGSLSVSLTDQVFQWETPLASLVPPKICPKDNAEMKGNWNFCPIHGDSLQLKNP